MTFTFRCFFNFIRSQVRSIAQNKIFNTVSTFPYSYIVLTPYIKEILQLNSSEHHERFKGCLYTLLGPKATPIITRHDWKFINELWPLLVASSPSEKLSIVNLMSAMTETIHRYFPTISIRSEIPDSCVRSALTLLPNKPAVVLNDVDQLIAAGLIRLKIDCEQKYRDYNEIISKLLHYLTKGNL